MATTMPQQESSTQKLKPLSALPLKHQRFIAEYLKDPNATKAAITCGYAEKAAAVMGHKLVTKYKAYVQRQAEVILRPKLHAAEVIVDRLQQIADSDIADFLTWDPESKTVTLKHPDEIPKALRRCIKSVTQHETKDVRYLKLELHSPVAALDKLAKYHNLFKRTVASKGLVVIINRPPATGPPQPTIINPKPNGNGHTNGKGTQPPQITFIRPNGGKTTAVTGSGSTIGKAAIPGHGGKA